MKILLCTLNARYIHSSLALHSLRSNCPDELEHIQIELREYTINQDLRDILADIVACKPDVIAFGLYIWNRQLIIRLARMIKQIFPDIRIIFGGPEVSYDPEDILAEVPILDAVIIGEGEISFWALIQKWNTDGKFLIDGVAESGDANLREHWKFQEIGDLDLLSFAYQQTLPSEMQGRIAYYESSRGCPFSCSYCLSGVGGVVRNRDFRKVTKELDLLLSFGVRQIKFVDRTFNADPAHFNEIISYIAGLETDVNFHFEMDAAILTEDTVDKLRLLPTGRVQLEIGIQSTAGDTLQAVGRHSAFQRESKIIKLLRERTNIHIHLDLIAGLPHEDYQTFGKSFNQVFALEPHQLQLGFLKMLRGSRIRTEAEQYKYCFDQEAPYEFLSNHKLSGEDVRKLKLIEHVLEETWNGENLKKTIQFLIENCYEGSAFQCFEGVSRILDDSSNLLTGRNGRWWVQKIYENIDKYWGLWRFEIESALKWDVLTMEKGKWRPAFIEWDSEGRDDFWRDEENVRKFLPDFRFTSWRDVQRKYRVESFSGKVIGVFDAEKVWVLRELESPEKWQRLEGLQC